jgi:hypothetical protein
MAPCVPTATRSNGCVLPVSVENWRFNTCCEVLMGYFHPEEKRVVFSDADVLLTFASTTVVQGNR